jgi:hypothetical protein
LKDTITNGDFPVGDLFFVGQKLIDVLAVSLKQILTILDSNDLGVEFICVGRGKGHS